MCWAICHDRVSRDAREGLGRKCGSRGLAPTCAGKNAGADRLVERGATAAHVFRRWKRRSEKAEQQDVPHPALVFMIHGRELFVRALAEDCRPTAETG